MKGRQYRQKGRGEKVRIALRTSDIASILGISASTLNTYVARGDIKFTDDPIEDLRMLIHLMRSRGILKSA